MSDLSTVQQLSQARVVRAPRGSQISCKNWLIEAAYRMLQNNLDAEVAENPASLVVYGGIGRAARDWPSFDAILAALRETKGSLRVGYSRRYKECFLRAKEQMLHGRLGRAELERVRLQREEIAAQREANHRLAEEARAKVAQQMQRHTTPQHTLNRLNTYRPEPEQQPEQERRFLIVGCPDDWTDAQALATATAASALDLPPVEPITDTVRQRLLDFVTDLYLDRDTDGSYRRIHTDGRLKKGVVAPWAVRSDLTQAQRKQLDELLRQLEPPLFRYDDGAKQWTLNLAHYKRVHLAVAAIDAANTLA